MNTRILKIAVPAMLAACSICSAQTEKSMIVEDGGQGPYKAEIVGDASLSSHTIYRPQDLKAAVEKNGKLPVILYANGACANTSVEIRYFLNELASQGYIAIAIGPYSEEDFIEHWKGVLKTMGSDKKDMILANGEKVSGMTEEEKAEMMANYKKMAEEAQKAAANPSKKSKKQAAEAPAEKPFQTYPKQMLEAMDWITAQNADPKSEYYHCIDLDHVAAMGQSCGGAQTLAVAHDPRIKTCVVLNSGIGDMSMAGIDKEQLKNLHTPMIYFNGGSDDVAYLNSQKDYERIDSVPVVLISTIVDGHEGSYYEAHGGKYATAVAKWLDWQLKGNVASSALFLDNDYEAMMFPGWTFERKGF